MESLFKSFIKFQSEFTGMKPDASNPFFKSSYITLDGILETVRPILAKNDLAVMQEATGDGEFIYVKTKLIHSSGEMLETELLKMKPQKNDPQQMGSCITYAKRYQLAALLGICESVDDDGNKATYGNGQPKGQSKGQSKSEGATGNINDNQIKRLYAIANKAGFDAEKIKVMVKTKYNKELKELTKVEYDHICNGLEGKVNG